MKIKILILVFFLIISTAGAILYNTRDEARNSILDYIQNINSVVDQAMSTITYTSEGNCTMTEFGDNIDDTCNLCFEFYYNETKKIEECTKVLGDATDEEIDNEVRLAVKEKTKRVYPKEEFKYTRKGFLGRKITVDIKE